MAGQAAIDVIIPKTMIFWKIAETEGSLASLDIRIVSENFVQDRVVLATRYPLIYLSST